MGLVLPCLSQSRPRFCVAAYNMIGTKNGYSVVYSNVLEQPADAKHQSMALAVLLATCPEYRRYHS